MLTGNTYDVGQVAPVSVLGERQQWEPHGARLHLLEMRLRLNNIQKHHKPQKQTKIMSKLFHGKPPGRYCQGPFITAMF